MRFLRHLKHSIDFPTINWSKLPKKTSSFTLMAIFGFITLQCSHSSYSRVKPCGYLSLLSPPPIVTKDTCPHHPQGRRLNLQCFQSWKISKSIRSYAWNFVDMKVSTIYTIKQLSACISTWETFSCWKRTVCQYLHMDLVLLLQFPERMFL